MAFSILVHFSSDDNPKLYSDQYHRDTLRPLSRYTCLTVGVGPNAPPLPLPSAISFRSRIIPALEDRYGRARMAS
jgi:hypothetical protein